MNSGRRSISLKELREKAYKFDGEGQVRIYWWLMQERVIPFDHVTTRKSVVRLGGDGSAIDVEYLASTAQEWDGWGKSTPREFVDALSVEYGEQFDVVSNYLTELGRE